MNEMLFCTSITSRGAGALLATSMNLAIQIAGVANETTIKKINIDFFVEFGKHVLCICVVQKKNV